MTQEQMQAKIDELTAKNAALEAKVNKPLNIKMSEKGGISVYGLQRFPVTLYPEQWERLATKMDAVHAFAKANEKELTKRGKASKAAKEAAKAAKA